MLTPRPSAPRLDPERSCHAALVEAQSLLEMAMERVTAAQHAAPPPLQGAMVDVVTRLTSDHDLLKAAADSIAPPE